MRAVLWRAARFARRVMRLVELVPMTAANGLCADELLQSAGAILACYGRCCPVRRCRCSPVELRVLHDEAGECRDLLLLLAAIGGAPPVGLQGLTAEADALVAAIGGAPPVGLQGLTAEADALVAAVAGLVERCGAANSDAASSATPLPSVTWSRCVGRVLSVQAMLRGTLDADRAR